MIKFTKIKPLSFKIWLTYILQGVCEILDGCVTLLSLGLYCSNFELSCSKLRIDLQLSDLKKIRKMSGPNLVIGKREL